jgi:glycopeptide antibiotics resistance protein
MKMKIARDKWRHFYAGIPLGVFCQLVADWLYAPPVYRSVIAALIAVAAVSYGFELFSKITGLGIYDFMDAVASLIGGVLGMLLVLCFDWLT